MANPDAFKQNGDRTPTQGPCECGYRHWCDGKEYDFVFQINLPNLPSGHLPFDLGGVFVVIFIYFNLLLIRAIIRSYTVHRQCLQGCS